MAKSKVIVLNNARNWAVGKLDTVFGKNIHS